MINKTVRRKVNYLFIIGFILQFYTAIFYTNTNIIYLIIIATVQLLFMQFYMRNVACYLPIIWSLFYLVGYVFGFVVNTFNNPSVYFIGIDYKDFFLYKNNSYFNLFLVQLSGLCGLFLASITFQKKLLITSRVKLIKNIEFKNKNMILYTWFIFTILLLLLMKNLGLGKTGIPSAVVLPFKLNGIIIMSRNVLIPFFAFFLFIFYLKANDQRKLSILLLMTLVISVFGSIIFLSRGFLIFMMAPTLLYILIYAENSQLTRKMRKLVFFILGLLILLLIPLIEALRVLEYGGSGVNVDQIYKILGKVNVFDVLHQIMSLFTGRVIGFKELTIVSAQSPNDLFAPWNVFVDNTDEIKTLLRHYFSFNPDTESVLSAGYAFGLWGQLFLSGSVLIVFLGTFSLALLIMLVETAYIKAGYHSLALLVSFIIGLWAWGGIDFYTLFRLILVSTLILIFVNVTWLSKYAS